MDKLPAQPNRSLMEGLEALLALAQRGGPVGVRELGRELGLTPSRAQRYLGTLAHLGLASRTSTGRYELGPGIHALSAMSLSASGLAGRAMSVLPGLSDLNLVVALGVLWRSTVNYLYFSMPGLPVSESIGRHHGFPARNSSIGMLMLAWKSPEYQETHFPEETTGFSKELEEVRKKQLAIVHQPNGETSIAVPLGIPPMAGLALSGKISKSQIPELVERMRATADTICSDK